MDVLLPLMQAYYAWVWCLASIGKGIRFSVTEVMVCVSRVGSGTQTCIPCKKKKRQVFITTGPSLYPPNTLTLYILIMCIFVCCV